MSNPLYNLTEGFQYWFTDIDNPDYWKIGQMTVIGTVPTICYQGQPYLDNDIVFLDEIPIMPRLIPVSTYLSTIDMYRGVF